MVRSLQYLFIAIIVTTVGFSLYQWNASRASTQKTAPNNGLVGYWSFNEGTGTLAGDASVNKNTGTLTSGPTWVNGKLGQAVSFDAVDDYIDAGTSSSLMPAFPFSISTWVMDGGVITTADPANNGEYSGYILIMGAGGVTAQIGDNNGYCSGARRNTYTTNATTLTAGRWYHVTAVFTNASSFSIFVNGASVTTTQSGTNGLSIGYAAGARFRIARYFAACGGTTSYSGGKVDEVRIYNRALSGTEITNLYNLGAEKLNVSPVSNLTSGLVGYWTFDGKDTPWSSSSAGTATDRSGNSNTGTLTNMSQSTSVIRGKLGQALNFDGVDDEITTTTNQGNGSAAGLQTLSLSAWFNTSDGVGGKKIIGLENAQTGTGTTQWDRELYLGTDGKIHAYVYDTIQKQAVSTAVYNDGEWHHAVATISANDSIKLYVDGVLQQSTAIGVPFSTYSTSYWRIGGYKNAQGSPYNGSDGYFSGKIDEVRIYNRVLFDDEVQSLYDLGASDKVNSGGLQDRLDSGLAGYWKLDDNSGVTAVDSSNNANNGTLTSGPTWGTGKIGSDVVFDGVDDYIATGNYYNVIRGTVSMWVNPTMTISSAANYHAVYSLLNGGCDGIDMQFDGFANRWKFNVWGGCVASANVSSPVIPSDGALQQWHHLVGVWDGSIGQRKLYVDGALVDTNTMGAFTPGHISYAIGGNTYKPWVGSIDEVRVYNRVLSATEVSQLYRLTASTDTSLKGYWSFNGKDTNWTSSSAGTVSDLSGNGNTGTLTNMSQSTSVIRGKLGQALNFDGTDDYTTTPDSSTLDITDSTNFTLTGWFNRNTFTTDDTIIGKSNGQASSDTGYNAYIDDSTDKLTIVGNDGTDQYKMESVSTFTATDWHHFALVWDDSSSANTKLYIDGVSEAATTTGTFANVNSLANALTFRIGAESDNGNPFDGKIDEVRIYNRALSSTEVSALYNAGR